MKEEAKVLVHMSYAEVNALLALQKGDPHRSPEGIPDLSEAVYVLLHNRKVRDAAGEAMKQFMQLSESQQQKLNAALNQKLGKQSVPLPGNVEKIASLGKTPDKELCLLPVYFVKLVLRWLKAHHMPVRVNPKTGLLELCDPLSIACVVGAGALWASHSAQDRAISRSENAFNRSAELQRQEIAETKRRAEAQLAWEKEQAQKAEAWQKEQAAFERQRMELQKQHLDLLAQKQAREEQFAREMAARQLKEVEDAKARRENYLQSVGYYDKAKVDNRPWREVPNPSFSADNAGWTTPVLKEFFDPKTGETLDAQGAWAAKHARDAADPDRTNALDAYEGTPAEQQRVEEYYKKRFGRPSPTSKAELRSMARGLTSPGKMFDEKAEKELRALMAAKQSDAVSDSDSRPSDSRPSDSRPSDSRPSDSRPSDSRPSDSRSESGLRSFSFARRPSSLEDLEDFENIDKSSENTQKRRAAELLKQKWFDSPVRTRIRQRKKSYSSGFSSSNDFAQGGLVQSAYSPGGIVGKGTGQSDEIRAKLPAGTYIVPADVVSHLGDGSSSAGIDHLDKTFHKLAPKEKIRRDIAGKMDVVPVRIANEEYRIDPGTVYALGGGDLSRGASKLDTLVRNVRKHAMSNGLKLPPAAKPVEAYL